MKIARLLFGIAKELKVKLKCITLWNSNIQSKHKNDLEVSCLSSHNMKEKKPPPFQDH